MSRSSLTTYYVMYILGEYSDALACGSPNVPLRKPLRNLTSKNGRKTKNHLSVVMALIYVPRYGS